VDFSSGVPRYRPYDGTAEARLARGGTDFALVLGTAADLPPALAAALAAIPHAAFGPDAATGVFASGAAAITTGVVGVHDAGMLLRMDDVPLDADRLLDGPPPLAPLLDALAARLSPGA
jgi:formylmethanofuran dehydrogenase subunit B